MQINQHMEFFPITKAFSSVYFGYGLKKLAGRWTVALPAAAQGQGEGGGE
jgi:hypothetical protein